MQENRFQDEEKKLSDFNKEVLVKCPSCNKKATAKVNDESAKAELICINCGFNKTAYTEVIIAGKKANVQQAAHLYFDAELWLQNNFKNEIFFAYNIEHLNYLERYISATLREHKNRTGFTLLEKLPKFYHEAKNREALLKIIHKLKIR